MASSEAAPSGPATGAEVKANGGPIQLENTSKRDFLTSLEKKYQEQWEAEKLFEVDSPMTTEKGQGLEDLTPEEIREKYPKWLGTFPYPYMNGSLHLGHAFSMSKVDFMNGFQRMLGKRALFPLGFHATGMPIRASADKLIREIEMFGKDFSGYKEEEEAEQKLEPDTDLNASSVTQSNVAKATKGKLQAKNTVSNINSKFLNRSVCHVVKFTNSPKEDSGWTISHLLQFQIANRWVQESIGVVHSSLPI
ncbi:hypothetical protein L7F22_052938 [Adiantum nelumboides]|nr:hypothetical protein [Adiantum nelumboides]